MPPRAARHARRVIIRPEVAGKITEIRFNEGQAIRKGAVVLRLAALWPSGWSAWQLQAAALFWIAAMGLYLWRFIPMLVRPRYTAPATMAPSVVQR